MPYSEAELNLTCKHFKQSRNNAKRAVARMALSLDQDVQDYFLIPDLKSTVLDGENGPKYTEMERVVRCSGVKNSDPEREYTYRITDLERSLATTEGTGDLIWDAYVATIEGEGQGIEETVPTVLRPVQWSVFISRQR